MCGIAGQVRSDGRSVERAVVERMCAAQEHRGPDSRGIHCEGQVGLGIQRLRVIDLKTGDQPVYNEDRSVAVVLNGEIYNYRELRRRLIDRGHRLSTEGDTEVIAHLYEDLGEDCVQELHGMFAFSLWDAKRERLLIARDRVGKKPLLYSARDGALSYASEMAALLEDPEVTRGVDARALDSYLALGYVPHPLSAFDGVRKLPPASLLSWSNGEIRIESYWSLRYQPKRNTVDRAQLGEEIRDQIRAAVRRRLVSDVPLGAFLSGGIDSGAVVAAMARESSEPVKTFSIGFEDERHSELPRARMVAERYSTDHREFIVRPNALEIIPEIVRHYGEPFADTSSVPSFHVSRIASEHVTVALNGDGGDESFAGYHRYHAALRAARLDSIPGPLRRGMAALAGSGPERGDPGRSANRARRYARQSAISPLERHIEQMSIFDERQRADLYSDDFRAAISDHRAAAPVAAAWDQAEGENLLDRLLETDLRTYLPDDLCFKIDIATMAHSLEARSPLLDHELLEFAATLPPEAKRAGSESKVALRDALRDWLPAEVLDGPKSGFGMPSAGEWFRGELRDFVSDVVLDPVALGRGYFRPEAVRRIVDEHIDGRAQHSDRLWSLMMLELWQREFLSGR